MQVPIGIVFGFVALAIVIAPFADPEGGQEVASAASTTVVGARTTLGTVTTLAPSTTVVALPAGDDTSVIRVTDGDSLVVADGTRVRLTGIDAPEAETDDCYSSEATARLRELIGPGTKIRLVYDVGHLDVYERTLAYVYRVSDGLFVNLSLARDGYVRQLPVRPSTTHADEIGRAVAEAQQAARGLWSACTTTTTGTPATIRGSVAPSDDGPTGPDPTIDTPATDDTQPAAEDQIPDSAGSGCHPSYGGCVPIASDVDCWRDDPDDRGNGPAYVYETNIPVIGPDVYGLDSDHDGLGCEPPRS